MESYEHPVEAIKDLLKKLLREPYPRMVKLPGEDDPSSQKDDVAPEETPSSSPNMSHKHSTH
jgi:hypothetical protein